MNENNTVLKTDRRKFISTVIPACAFSCLGIKSLIAADQTELLIQDESKKHKFQKEWGHTYEEAFRWKFNWIINIMNRFGDYLGRDNFIDMIKRAGDELCEKESVNDPDFSFIEWIKGGSKFDNMMTYEIIESNDKVYEMRVTECLWEKVFREKDATEIGYAYVCYNDFSAARSANPKIKLERTKSLMEGHGFCNHRWTFDV